MSEDFKIIRKWRANKKISSYFESGSKQVFKPLELFFKIQYIIVFLL